MDKDKIIKLLEIERANRRQKPWTKEEREIVGLAVKNGYMASELFKSKLLPGRSMSSIEHCIKRIRGQ